MSRDNFPDIKDDAEFRVRLLDAIEETERRIDRDPDDSILAAFQAQLGAIAQWARA